MSKPPIPLERVRDEIDAIDREMLNLLQRRTALVDDIKAAKHGRSAIQPGREAMVLRRLLGAHHGRFPVGSLVRIWREIISVLTLLQDSFSVAIYVPEEAPGLWDIARDHYGSQTPFRLSDSALQVIRAVSDGSATIGVLPWPADGEQGGASGSHRHWWPGLLDFGENRPRVIARLPFAGSGNARDLQGGGVAVALADPTPTGDDHSLLVLRTDELLSRGSVQGLAKVSAIDAQVVASHDGTQYLLDVGGFVDESDPRTAELLKALAPATVDLAVLGAYPTPVAVSGQRAAT